MEKAYYIIVLRFGKNDENSYSVYSYQKSRRFTPTQARRHVFMEKHEPMKTGKLKKTATILDAQTIAAWLQLPCKQWDPYYWFEHITG